MQNNYLGWAYKQRRDQPKLAYRIRSTNVTNYKVPRLGERLLNNQVSGVAELVHKCWKAAPLHTRYWNHAAASKEGKSCKTLYTNKISQVAKWCTYASSGMPIDPKKQYKENPGSMAALLKKPNTP